MEEVSAKCHENDEKVEKEIRIPEDAVSDNESDISIKVIKGPIEVVA